MRAMNSAELNGQLPADAENVGGFCAGAAPHHVHDSAKQRDNPPSATPVRAGARSGTGFGATVPAEQPSEPGTLLFHEPWWLAAVTGGAYREVKVTRGDQVVGRLPYTLSRQAGFSVSHMPPFTHVLGPALQLGSGKPQTLVLRRLSVIRELLDQLPPVASFKQALALSLVDGLAFQERGFQVSPQYTFQIDCRGDVESLWSEVHFKTRQHIRRAEEKFEIRTITDPRVFIDFYLDNVRRTAQRSFIDFTHFPTLFAATRERDCAEILCAAWPDGKPTAMVVLVWGKGKMYYLLSTRARDKGDNGSINLLIWEGIRRAHVRGLVFDLDGVSTIGTARFLSGFGGRFALRLIVQRTSSLYRTLRGAKRCLGMGKADDTFAFT
jgi:hypothetical protein